jgi:lysophospholipase
VLFMPGRGDAYEKYLEALDHWAGEGWTVTAADWRGQGGSGRLGTDAVTGHIGDFTVWIDDLASFWAQWIAQTPAPHVLMGHSMGGHLVLRAAVEGQVRPDALVLSAPMLGFTPIGLPPALLHQAARLMCRIGDPRRPAWKWSEKPGQPPESRITLLTHDEDRYEDELWWREHRPELVMGPGSWRWIERAYASMRQLARPGVLEGLDVPTLVIATTADGLVDGQAARKAADRLPKGELLLFGKEARHEILRESDPVRARAMATIDEFLARIAPSVEA